MNQYIEFAQWLRAQWKDYYASHGTKVLGYASAALGTLQTILALLTASPDVRVLVTPKEFALLVVFNIVLGVLVVKRGFTNTRNAT